MQPQEALPLVEPFALSDTFADCIARIEQFAGMTRFYLGVHVGDHIEVVCRLVIPTEAVHAMAIQSLNIPDAPAPAKIRLAS